MNWSQVRRMIAAGLIGNVLEWYDFAIYGYFATAIGHQRCCGFARLIAPRSSERVPARPPPTRDARVRRNRAVDACRQSRKAASGGVNLSFSASATARCVIMPS